MMLRGLFRNPMILLIGTAGCAIALLWPSPAHRLDRIESAAPSYNAVPITADPSANVDSAMIALQREANLALAQLQTRAQAGR